VSDKAEAQKIAIYQQTGLKKFITTKAHISTLVVKMLKTNRVVNLEI